MKIIDALKCFMSHDSTYSIVIHTITYCIVMAVLLAGMEVHVILVPARYLAMTIVMMVTLY